MFYINIIYKYLLISELNNAWATCFLPWKFGLTAKSFYLRIRISKARRYGKVFIRPQSSRSIFFRCDARSCHQYLISSLFCFQWRLYWFRIYIRQTKRVAKRQFIHTIEHDIDWNTKIFGFLRQIPPFSMSFKEWSERTCLLLYDYWKLEKLPVFVPYQKQNGYRMLEIVLL